MSENGEIGYIYLATNKSMPGLVKSGIGRERGLETLANYTRIKNVVINIGG